MTDFFMNNAYAQAAAPVNPGGSSQFIMLGVIFVVFWFFLIRPQMKQAKEHKNMVEALAKGDEVVTSGGLLGKITQVGESFVLLEIAKDVEVKVQKHSISATMPKGTMKTL